MPNSDPKSKLRISILFPNCGLRNIPAPGLSNGAELLDLAHKVERDTLEIVLLDERQDIRPHHFKDLQKSAKTNDFRGLSYY